MTTLLMALMVYEGELAGMLLLWEVFMCKFPVW